MFHVILELGKCPVFSGFPPVLAVFQLSDFLTRVLLIFELSFSKIVQCLRAFMRHLANKTSFLLSRNTQGSA